ncbi:FAD-dependent oxidoreductase [Streptomyces sp. NPDC046203]|uniref:NAD(P)/FAD-dependent oxidoreductase n=1 Tax=Streptomyces sp. NPDC046203 TaxID=3154602 RepID=UPI003409B9A9
MTTAVIAGGGFAGLAAALALGERGHRVIVLEPGPPPPEGPPGKAADDWRQPLVPQLRQPHILNSLGVRVLARRAPRLLDEVRAEGALPLRLAAAAPPTLVRSAGAAADPELRALGVRRTTLELVLQRAVRALPHVRLRYGVKVQELVLAPGGRAVAGVVTADGERITAETVVDATGRRAAHRNWLAAAGFPLAPDLVEPSGIRVFSRFFRLRGPAPTDVSGLPGFLNRGNAAGGIWPHYAAVLHPADGGIFSVSLGVPTGDRPTAGLRHGRGFAAAARISPYLGPWMEPGVATPLGPVRTMAHPPNILRGLPDGTPGSGPAGLFPVGDAACVTDPIFGRGLSLALAHAFALADLLDAGPRPGEAGSGAARALADRLLRPWYEYAAADAPARIAHWRAAVSDTSGGQRSAPVRATSARTAPTGTAAVRATPAGRPSIEQVAAAALVDGEVWRGLQRMLMGLDTPDVLFDTPDLRDRVRTAPPPSAPPVAPAPPSRARLLAAVSETKVV